MCRIRICSTRSDENSTASTACCALAFTVCYVFLGILGVVALVSSHPYKDSYIVSGLKETTCTITEFDVTKEPARCKYTDYSKNPYSIYAKSTTVIGACEEPWKKTKSWTCQTSKHNRKREDGGCYQPAGYDLPWVCETSEFKCHVWLDQDGEPICDPGIGYQISGSYDPDYCAKGWCLPKGTWHIFIAVGFSIIGLILCSVCICCWCCYVSRKIALEQKEDEEEKQQKLVEVLVQKRLASHGVGDSGAGKGKRELVKNELYLGRRPVLEDSENQKHLKNEVYLGKRPVFEDSKNKKKRRRRRPGRYTSYDASAGYRSHGNQAGNHHNIPIRDELHTEVPMRSSEGRVRRQGSSGGAGVTSGAGESAPSAPTRSSPDAMPSAPPPDFDAPPPAYSSELNVVS